MKSLFMRDGNVRVIDSYSVSEESGEIYEYWCLPKGMYHKNEMDVEVHCFDNISAYHPDIVFKHKSAFIFKVVEEVKKLGAIKVGLVLDSFILYSFLLQDYEVNSCIIECIISIIYKKSVVISLEDNLDGNVKYYLR